MYLGEEVAPAGPARAATRRRQVVSWQIAHRGLGPLELAGREVGVLHACCCGHRVQRAPQELRCAFSPVRRSVDGRAGSATAARRVFGCSRCGARALAGFSVEAFRFSLVPSWSDLLVRAVSRWRLIRRPAPDPGKGRRGPRGAGAPAARPFGYINIWNRL
jgi:hypothetical protein